MYTIPPVEKAKNSKIQIQHHVRNVSVLVLSVFQCILCIDEKLPLKYNFDVSLA